MASRGFYTAQPQEVLLFYGLPKDSLGSYRFNWAPFELRACTVVQMFIIQATDPDYLVGGCTALLADAADL